MEPDRAGRVVLDLNPGEPISGRIQGAGGEPEHFHGWVELAGKLERLRGGIDPRPGGSAEDETRGPS